jgi:histidinol-phosphate aminotransferase
LNADQGKIHSLARRNLLNFCLPPPLRKPHYGANVRTHLEGNENPFAGELAHYPPINPLSVRNAYLKYLWERNEGAGLTEDNLLLTCGSAEGIDLIIRAFCEPTKDLLCITPPTFPMYAHWAIANGVEVVTVPLLGSELNRLNLTRIVGSGAKLLFLCNPNNPVGTSLLIDELICLLEEFSGIVAIDEAYIDVSEQLSSSRWVHKFPNLIILRTLSKTLGLAAARVGVVISSESVLQALKTIQVPYSIASHSQTMVENRLKEFEKLHSWSQIIKSERGRLIRELKRKGIVRRVYESETNFVLVEVEDPQWVFSQLLEKGILVGDYSADVEGALRISIGTPDDNSLLLDALDQLSRGRSGEHHAAAI